MLLWKRWQKRWWYFIDNPTISGETNFRKIKDAYIKDTNIIHTIDNPYSAVGGLAILYGNLAEQGAVIKTAGITGREFSQVKAVCFDGQPEAIKGIVSGKVKAGDVVVIDMKVQKEDLECKRC